MGGGELLVLVLVPEPVLVLVVVVVVVLVGIVVVECEPRKTIKEPNTERTSHSYALPCNHRLYQHHKFLRTSAAIFFKLFEDLHPATA